MKISASKRHDTKTRIVAADEDFLEMDDTEFNDEDVPVDAFDDQDGFDDQLDEMAENIEDMQDTLDEVTEDDVDIEIDNNLEGHLIAECDKCHGIFISAMVESDQDVEKITGICPLCEKESDQYFKWVIKAIDQVIICLKSSFVLRVENHTTDIREISIKLKLRRKRTYFADMIATTQQRNFQNQKIQMHLTNLFTRRLDYEDYSNICNGYVRYG